MNAHLTPQFINYSHNIDLQQDMVLKQKTVLLKMNMTGNIANAVNSREPLGNSRSLTQLRVLCPKTNVESNQAVQEVVEL